MQDLAQKRCTPCSGDAQPMTLQQATHMRAQLAPEWELSADTRTLSAHYEFKNYYQTTAFVNAVIYVAHREDHHPDIAFGYRTCSITWWTHAVNGLTENDFICAAKVDALRA